MVKNTRKKGGKYIAQGSYGCVFGNPPLKCKNENTRRNNSIVSKLQTAYSTENEFEETKEWHTIDPENKFSITPIKLCDYDNSNVKESNNMGKCRLRLNGSDKQILLYKHGGTDLLELKVKASNYANLFSGFYELFKGLAVAHQYNIIHSDIKPENILAEQTKTNIHLRFIDFGMSYKITNKNKLENLIYGGYLKFLYYYWPLEVKFLIDETLDSDYLISKSFNNHVQMLLNKLRFIVPRSVLLNKNTNNAYSHDEIKELYKGVNLKKYLTKLDVYSMGVTICQLASYYFKQYMTVNNENKDIIKIILPDISIPINVEDLDKIESKYLTNEIIEWHKTLAKEVTKPLYTLMLKLLDFDPIKRLSAEEAAEEYKNLLPSFSKYLNDKKMIEKVYEAYPEFLDQTPSIENPPTPSLNKPKNKPTLKRQLSFYNNNNTNTKRIKRNNK